MAVRLEGNVSRAQRWRQTKRKDEWGRKGKKRRKKGRS